jgi:hypothetical protein
MCRPTVGPRRKKPRRSEAGSAKRQSCTTTVHEADLLTADQIVALKEAEHRPLLIERFQERPRH